MFKLSRNYVEWMALAGFLLYIGNCQRDHPNWRRLKWSQSENKAVSSFKRLLLGCTNQSKRCICWKAKIQLSCWIGPQYHNIREAKSLLFWCAYIETDHQSYDIITKKKTKKKTKMKKTWHKRGVFYKIATNQKRKYLRFGSQVTK